MTTAKSNGGISQNYLKLLIIQLLLYHIRKPHEEVDNVPLALFGLLQVLKVSDKYSPCFFCDIL